MNPHNADLHWLVLGGTGFIGGHVAAHARTSGRRITTASRTPPAGPGNTHRSFDLSDPVCVEAAIDDIDVIVHSASYIGRNPEWAHRVNVEGTRTVVGAAARADTPVIYISTASVTGAGPHRGSDPSLVRIHPQSVASRSRAIAEAIVRDAGGVVLRPHLVYGPGDRWFIPTLQALLRTDGSAARMWGALVSTVHVHDLARAVLSAVALPTASTHFVGAPRPDKMSDIATLIAASAPGAPGHANTPNELSEHQRSMLTTDSWFQTIDLWNDLSIPSATQFELSALDVDWYSSPLASA